jgi:hypothetical protein
MPSIMSNDENPYCVTGNTKEKVVGEAMQVDAPNVALAKGEHLWSFCGGEHGTP